VCSQLVPATTTTLRKLGSKALRGIVFSPSFGPNCESAEAEVAALARERSIPVVIPDSPVKASSPLASCPYFGTDNTAAGRAMAEVVQAAGKRVYTFDAYGEFLDDPSVQPFLDFYGKQREVEEGTMMDFRSKQKRGAPGAPHAPKH